MENNIYIILHNMHIKKNEAKKHENSATCTVWEYDFPNKNIGLAITEINGIYPEKGKACNTECDTIYYILEGKGTIHCENTTYEVTQGDAILLEKGKHYVVEGTDLKVALPTAPARYFTQYKIIS